MTAYPIPNPFAAFNDLSGLPMTGGYVYIGLPNQDPETSPMAVYTDEGLSIPFAQPLRTVGGYLIHTGTPANAYPASTPYSIRARDALGVEIFYAPEVHDHVAEAIAAITANLAASSGSSLIGFIQSGTGATPRTVQDKLRDFVGVTDFGGAADGTTDNSGAVTAAQATGRNVVFQSGVHKFNSNVTIRDPIVLRGATLKPANGATVTISGTMVAPLTQIFDLSLGGLIVIDPASDIWGLPEWWGAVPGGADCYAAIMACYTAARRMRFQAASYFSNQTLIFDQAFKRIEGAERDYNGSEGQATRILVNSASANAVQFGPTTMPVGGFNAFPQGIEAKGIWFARTAAPTIAGGSVAVVIQYTLRGFFEDITAAESITGFLIRGTVDTELEACRAFRASAGTGGGADKWYGYDADGTISIGAAGGNASLRITNCRSAYGGTPPANSIGLRLHGAITDTFVKEFEDVTDMVGIQVTGLGPTDTNIVGNMDVLFQHPVCDQNGTAPIYIQDINPYGSIELVNPYAGAAGGSAVAGIFVQNCAGTVSIKGGQVPMTGASGVAGISADNCQRILIDNTIVMESSSASAAVIINNCCGVVKPVVTNYQNVVPTAVLVQGASTDALRVAPMVSGSTSAVKFAHAITVAAGASNNSIYEVGAARKAVMSGAKLVIGGVDQTTPGVVPAAGTSVLVGPTT